VRLQKTTRSGATLVECAVVYPITFFVLLALMIGGMGAFRFQELALLARMATRYASVHGKEWSKAATEKAGTYVPPATPEDIYNNVIKPIAQATGLDVSKLTYTVSYNTDNSSYSTGIVNGNVVAYANTVTITVNYKYSPQPLLGTTFTMTSTSTIPMSY
jgi:hypothetical protein